MTTITSGSSGFYKFTDASKNIAIVIGLRARAHVNVISSAGALLYSDNVQASRTLGPFPSGAVAVIEAVGGSVDYDTQSGASSGSVSPLSLNARGLFTFKPSGLASQSGATALTRRTVIALPAPVSAVRIRIHEWFAAVTGLRASLSWLDDPANASSGSLVWNRALFGGVDTVDIAAPTSGSGLTAAGIRYAESDIIQAASVPVSSSVLAHGHTVGAIANIMVAQNAQATSRWDYYSNPTTVLKGGVECSFVIGVDGVVTPASYVSQSAASNGSAIELVCYTPQDTRTFLNGGASTAQGHYDNDGSNLGWGGRACAKITDLNVVHMNMGWTGRTTENSLAVCIEALARIKPTAATFSAFSLNDSDTGTAAGDTRQLSVAIRWIEACRANGVRPVITTTQYSTGATANQNTSRVTHNNTMRVLNAAGVMQLIDLDAFYTPNNAWADPTWTVDGQHIASPGLNAGELTFANQVLFAVS